jgi:hypothetical protein
VTAGDEVIVYLELSPDLEGVGLLNTSLALRVTPPPFSIFGASGTVALKATTAWFYNAGPGLYVSLDITCANIGSDNAVQLGEASSPCGQGGAQDNNDLRFNVNVTNLGAQTGTFTIDLPGAPFGQLCNVGPNLPVAPGQTLSVPCEASALANATHGFNADLGATYPLTVVTSNHTYTFGFPVDIQPSPVSSPPSGGGSSSGGGGGSGGGGTVPCSIAPDGVCTGAGCLTCVYNAGDGCVTLGGSFCSYYDAQQTVQGYGVCCWTTSEPATDTCGASAACDQDGSGQ